MALVGRLSRASVLKIHPETVVDNFSAIDCDLAFYSLVRSLYHRYPIKAVLDYGAGRNRYAQDFNADIDSFLIRELRDLRFGGANVTAVDVEHAVLNHPTSDRQAVIDPAKPLPFEDCSFDLIVSDYVFEHVQHASIVARELQRTLRPGGWLLVRTPNKFGYLKLAASLVPNSLHVAVLRWVSPHRASHDSFPTHYHLNSKADLSRHFDQCAVYAMSDSWEPAYFFGRLWLYRVFAFVHKILPKFFGTASIFALKKSDR